MNNILITISIILNGILLAFLFGLVPLLLYISIAVNILFLWYVRKSIMNTSDVQEDLLVIMRTIEGFTDHLENLHSMEMFYGEPVLQDLINHSKTTTNDIVDVLEKYYDERVEEIDDDEENNEEEEKEEPILY